MTSTNAEPQGASPDQATQVAFSPIDNELPLRWQRALHLAPTRGLGVVRRAVFFALLTWLPIAVWAFVRGRFSEVAVGEPPLQHHGVHVRCLVAIPLLILGEASLHAATLAAILGPIVVPMLVVAGLKIPLKDLLLDLVKTLIWGLFTLRARTPIA